MSMFLEAVVPVLTKTWNFPKPLQTITLILDIVVCLFFLYTFFPNFLRVRRTKNTVGINRRMFALQTLVAFLFVCSSICLFIKGYSIANISLLINGIAFTLQNMTTCSCNSFVFYLKNKNMKEAKSMGLSEYDHYHQVCVPAAQVKVDK